MQGTQQLANLYQAKTGKMSQVVRYRQYWMATLKDRHWCQICGELAINAVEYVRDDGICERIVWHCNSCINFAESCM